MIPCSNPDVDKTKNLLSQALVSHTTHVFVSQAIHVGFAGDTCEFRRRYIWVSQTIQKRFAYAAVLFSHVILQCFACDTRLCIACETKCIASYSFVGVCECRMRVSYASSVCVDNL